ncbi:MAG: signal peptidase I [Dehalococcoidia bacterium]|nr:signal peptidase I [Dehalococcoidia bacterium]
MAATGRRMVPLEQVVRGLPPLPDRWRAVGPSLRRLMRMAVFGLALLVLAGVAASALPIVFGYDAFVMTGGSMSPAIRPGSVVVAERVDPALVRAGDVITFRRPLNPASPVTHRVVDVGVQEGVTVFQTKGDANQSPDPGEVRAELPISRMVYTIPYAGYLLAFATSPVGKALLVGMPAVVLAALAFWRPSGHARPLSAIARGVVDPEAVPDLLARARQGVYRVPPPLPADPPPSRRATAAPTRVATTPEGAPLEAAQAAPPVPAEAPPPPPPGTPPVSPLAALAPRIEAPPPPEREPREAMRSTHVERLRRFLDAQREVEDSVAGLLDRETAPVRDILRRYDRAMARLETAADAQLGPLQEFARGEEANLESLIAKMKAEGAAAYRASLPYFERSRDRLAETYRRIDHHRLPVLEYGEAQRQAVDAVLGRFEDELATLESGLKEQQAAMHRMVRGMREPAFQAALAHLNERAARMVELTEAGANDVADLSDALRAPRQLSLDATYLGVALDVIDAADRRYDRATADDAPDAAHDDAAREVA